MVAECVTKGEVKATAGEIVAMQEAECCYCQPCMAPSASAPLPVLAIEQRSVNSRSIAELFSLCNNQTLFDTILVFWGIIFKSSSCFLRSIVFSAIFFCRFKMRSSFMGLSPDWDFFFSSCLKSQKETMRR